MRLDKTPRYVIFGALFAVYGLATWLSQWLRWESAVAIWWPVAALGAFIVIAARRQRALAAMLVALVAGVSSIFPGRPAELGVALSVMNAMEALVIAVILAGLPVAASSEGQLAARRFLVAIASGALTAGVLGGAALAVWANADFVSAAGQLATSHGAALALLLPLGLTPWRRPRRLPIGEMLIQLVVHVALFALLYGIPEVEPLAFLLLLSLLWAALRFPLSYAVAQMAVTGIAVIVATANLHGPFASILRDDPARAVQLAQIWLIVHACAVVVLGAARNDWRAASAAEQARERDLRSGIASTETGLLLAERKAGLGLRVLAVNDTALRALAIIGTPHEWSGRRLSPSQEAALFRDDDLRRLVLAHEPGRLDIVQGDERYAVEVSTADADSTGGVITIALTNTTARDLRERQSREAMERLEDLNAQKDSFISSVSHELRTPVTSILGFSEVLNDSGLVGDAEQASAVIGRNARRLAAVIEDVLELSQLSTIGSAPPRIESIALAEFIGATIDELSGVAHPAGVSVVLDDRSGGFTIRSIERDLVRVCTNVLSNAIKFSPTGATVTVVVSRLSGEHRLPIEIRVVDEGLGIPEAYRESVWERFVRVPEHKHQAIPGTGLGLPIVRALVEQRLGGTVQFAPTTRGTAVVVRLPETLDRTE